MKYYKYLDLNHKIVSDFFLTYYEKNKSKINNFWNNINTKIIFEECTDIQKMFSPLNLTIKRISLIKSGNTSFNDGVHKDSVPEKVRINIPILNCENSVTNFYKTNKEPIQKLTPNGIPYYYFNTNDCELVDSFCLTQPAAINIHALHQVVVTKPNIVRISCTIAFNENIEYLLD